MYLTSSCTGMPCARIETNLLGTRYEVVLDSTVQPFAQHEATHSHTAPMTFDKLPSVQHAQSMQSVQSGNYEFDVPVVDLPSTSQAAFAPATPSISCDSAGRNALLSQAAAAAAHTDLSPDEPVSSASSNMLTQPKPTKSPWSDLAPSPAASGSFLSRFRTSQAGPNATLQSPFAAMTSDSAEQQIGCNLPTAVTSPSASSSFLASCQSATEGWTSGHAHAGFNLPPTTPSSASDALFARSRSAWVEGSGPVEDGSASPSCSCHVVPKTVGGVQYKTRIRGFMRPRRYKHNSSSHAEACCLLTASLLTGLNSVYCVCQSYVEPVPSLPKV